MKKILLIPALVLVNATAFAQSFLMQDDTVEAFVPTYDNLFNQITNIAADSIIIDWRVTASDFPADWATANALGICDNYLCRTNYNNQLLDGSTYTTDKYPPGQQGDFHMQINLSAASTGTHYLTMELKEGTNQTTNITFIVHHFATNIETVAERGSLTMYPIPAKEELFIDIETKPELIVYDMQGRKLMRVTTKVLDVRELPTGQYLIEAKTEAGTQRKVFTVVH